MEEFEERPEVRKTEITKIEDLKRLSPEDYDNAIVNIVGRVVKVREKIVETQKGLRRVLNMLVSDGTGFVWFSYWSPRVEIEEGDIIKIINPIVSEWKGNVRLSSSYTTRVIKDPIDDERYSSVPSLEDLYEYLKKSVGLVPIGDIIADTEEYNGKIVNIIGTVMKVYRVRKYVKTDENGEEKQFVVGEIGIDDGTGYIKAVLWNELINFLGISPDEVPEDIDEAKKVTAKVSPIGREVTIRGKVKILQQEQLPSPKAIKETVTVYEIDDYEFTCEKIEGEENE